MTRRLAALALAAPLFACTQQQLTSFQSGEAQVAAAIQNGCAVANQAAALAAPFAAVPQVAGVIAFIQGGCATEGAVAALIGKALNDPTTVAWVEKLPADLQRAKASVGL